MRPARAARGDREDAMLDRPTLPVDDITQIAANSALARRRIAPPGYVKGMAVMFAVVQRKLAQSDPAALEMAKPASGDTDHDALAHYASRFAALGMRNDRGGAETLRHLFVLMFGLGLRESSGRYCEGYDRESQRNRLTSETAEAGLFQMSWDARAISPFIKPLCDEYNRTGGGYKSIFAEGVTPRSKDLETVGSGDGATFQHMMKEMPGLAVETAAVGLRKNGGATGHWGPIRRHEAQLLPEADEMLQQVQSLMSTVPPGDIVIRPDVPVVPVPVHDTLWVQRSLNTLGANPPLAEDGVNGPLTMAAVLQFQQANFLFPSGFADPATIGALERKLRPTIPGPGPVPSGPTDLIALLERLVMLIEKLKGQRPITDPSSALSPADRLRKTVELLSAILSPGTAGKPQPLGQVNGALGQTIGNLLDGKKTAIGLLGAVATPLLSHASDTATLGPLLATLTPAAGLSGFALPVFLGMTAWGVLGKMEKWAQRTAPPSRSSS
jgi:peptidoglycan hydrolase-like protein with peptidoglycan-binding domain